MIPDDLTRHLCEWLPAAGFAEPGEVPRLTFLGGGVSNDVVAVTTGRGAFVYKRALPKLRVAAEWLSDVGRVRREAAMQRWLQRVLRPGEVPAVLAEDAEGFGYLMERAPAEAVNWKSEMLAGRVPPGAAARAGSLLGRLHAAGAADAAARAELADKTVFDQLRLDPYFRTVAERYPELRPRLRRLVGQLVSSDETIVHGDFSPKNLLLHGEGLILLDHEVAHTGDPRFDLGFFFTHLFLKALHLGLPALWNQPHLAWQAYHAEYPSVPEASWLPHIGACLLARVDGKSPAEYLREETKPVVRELGTRLLRRQRGALAEAVEMARKAAAWPR